MVVPAVAATTTATTVQLCSYSTAVAACSQATTAGFHLQLSVLQLCKGGTLHSRVPHAQAKQLTMSSGTHGQSTKGPTEGSCTMD
jgi:hypothetical protein